MVLSIMIGPEDHHNTPTMFDCWHDALFMKRCVGFYARCNGTHHFYLISPQNICLKVLGIIKIFFRRCETSLRVFLGRRWLLNSFCPSLFLIVES